MLVRAVQAADLPALLALARCTGVGVTSLPANEARLAKRVAASLASMAVDLAAHDSSFLFVLEDTSSRQVVGICGLEGAVGGHEPWYNYRVGLTVKASHELQIYRRLTTLCLTNDLTGASELCSLFLHPDWRKQRNGALLSKARFLFLAEFPHRFAPLVIAEMRGVSDEQGRSPFWESLGRHFFSMEFSEADYLTGVGDKSFIAELMPQHLVYTAFLSSAAQAVIGEVHQATRPARALLESEGFRYNGFVDIFDAGPTLACELQQIRAVRDSHVVMVTAAVTEQASTADAVLYLVSNRRLAEFRVMLVACEQPVVDTLALTAAQRQNLQIDVGDTVRVVPLSASTATH